MMKIPSVSALALACLFVTTGGALAALPPVNDEGAAALSKELEGFVGSFIRNELDLPEGLVPSGAISVKPNGDHYTYEIPPYTAKFPEGSLKISPFTGTLTPTEGDLYAFTLELPTNVANLLDVTGSPMMSFTVGSHEINGKWGKELIFLPELRANLGDVIIKNEKEKLSIGIKSIDGKMTNTVNAEEKTFSDFNATLQNISLLGDTQQVSIGGVSLASSSQGGDYQAMKKFAALAPQGKKAEAHFPKMFDALATIGGEATYHMDFQDISMSYQSPSNLSDRGKWSLARIYFNSKGRANGETGLASMAIDFGHEGFSMNPPSTTSLGSVLPATSRFAFDIENFPAVDVMRQYTEKTLAGLDVNGAAFLNSLSSLFVRSQTKLSITEAAMRTPDVSMTLTGEVVPMEGATFGTVGKFAARIVGIDELVEKLGRIANGQDGSAAGNTSDPFASGLLMAFGIAQMQGRPVADRVPSERTYDFELTKAGGFLLNGVDLGFLRQVNAPKSDGEQPQIPPTVNYPPLDAPALD